MDGTARQIALAELHARPAPQAGRRGHITRLVYLFNEGGAQAAISAFTLACVRAGAKPPPAGARYHVIDLDRRELRWELHTEFVSFTLVSAGDGRSEDRWNAFNADGLISNGHGQLAAKIAIAIVDQDIAGQDLASATDKTLTSLVAGGRARVATTFRADESGFVRFVLQHENLSPDETGELVQQILEIETYRMLALMALPLARRIGALVQELDGELGGITKRIEGSEGEASNSAVFADLSRLSARVESELASAAFRISAALAYGAIVEDRVRALNEQGEHDNAALGAFLMTRLHPAMRTCASMRQALSDLAQRCVRATDMIRTRIDLQLAQQNNVLLNALNERTRLQSRLQQTVEGLSIAAISYYIVGLTGYAAKGAKDAGYLPFDPAIVMGAAVPIVVACVAYIVWRVRRAHSVDRHEPK